MSTLKVEICKIEKLEDHTNADRLEIVLLKGWSCVVQKGSFKQDDLCLYIPIDSILPEEVELKIFGNDSKIKLHKHRVQTIKLRKVISQGLVVRPELLGIDKYKEGQDFTEQLNIIKYEPPEVNISIYGKCNKIKKRYVNSNFKKYTDIENIKNYNKVFTESDIVSITCKLHGTNYRCGWVENEANTVWKKIKKFFGLLDKYEFIFGSRNVQLSYKNKSKYFYDSNVYAKATEQYDLKNKLKIGEILYGEIVGWKIQSGYNYGCKEGEIKLYVFDIMRDNKYVDTEEFNSICKERDIPIVPELYLGNFDIDKVKECTQGKSVVSPEDQPVREGCVIKSVKEEISPLIGRKILKSINSEYLLLKNGSDFH